MISTQERKRRFQLACPLPKMDYDVITLGHGSGGLLTNRLLDNGVFKLLSNPELDRRHDGAIFEADGRMAFSTDSFVISPIFFPGGNIGELAVNGTVNDLAMCGAVPQYISLSFILEEGLSIEEFWKILVSVKFACQEAKVEVVTGDTKVVERGKGDKVFINTTGVGSMHPKAHIDIKRIQPGSKIIVSDAIATHGMAIMSVRKGLEFETTLQSDTRNLNHLVKALLDEFGSKIQLLRDPTRGGVGTVLTEIARDTKLGVDIFESEIPVEESVRGACEILGLDPLYVANEGVFVAIVDPEIADAVVAKMSTFEISRQAAEIGQISDQHQGKVILTSAIGGTRVVNMLVGEQLPRIC